MATKIIIEAEIDTGNSAKDLIEVEKSMNRVSDAENKLAKSTKNLSDETKKLTDNTKNFLKETKYQKNLDDLNNKIAKGGMSIRDLGKAVKQYQDIAAKAGEDSPIGQAAIHQAAELQDRIGDLRAQVSNLGHDGKNMQAALQLGGTVVAGYSAFQGVVAMLGVEDEKLLEVITKLQAAQSTLAAIEQVRAALEKESFLMLKLKNVQLALQNTNYVQLGKTLLKHPAFLMAAAVTATVIALKEFMDTNNQLSAQQKANSDIQKKASDAFAEERVNLERLVATAKDENLSRRERQTAIETLQATYPGLLKNISLENIGTKEMNEAIQTQIKLLDLQTRLKAAQELELEKVKEQMKAENSTLEENNGFWSYSAQLLNNHLAAQQLQASNRQTSIDKNKEEAETYKAKAKEIQKEIDLIMRKNSQAILTDKELEANAQAEEDRQKKLEEEQKAAAQRAEELRRKKAEEEEKYRQLALERDKRYQELVIANIQDETERALAEMKFRHAEETRETIEKFGLDTELLKQLNAQQEQELTDFKIEQQKKSQERLDAETKAANEKARQDRVTEAQLRLLETEGDFEKSFEAQKELLAAQESIEIAAAIERGDSLLLIQEEYNKKERELDEAHTQAKIQQRQKEKDAMLFAAEGIVNGLTGIGELAIKNEEKAAKFKAVATAAQLALDTAKAIGNVIAGATAAAAAGGPAAPFLLVGYIASGIATVTMNMKKAIDAFKQAKVGNAPSLAGGGSGGGGSGSNSSSTERPTGPETETAQFFGNKKPMVKTVTVLEVEKVNKANERLDQIDLLSNV